MLGADPWQTSEDPWARNGGAEPSASSEPAPQPLGQGTWKWIYGKGWQWLPKSSRASRSSSRGRAALQRLATEEDLPREMRQACGDLADRLEQRHRDETPLETRLKQMRAAKERHEQAIETVNESIKELETKRAAILAKVLDLDKDIEAVEEEHEHPRSLDPYMDVEPAQPAQPQAQQQPAQQKPTQQQQQRHAQQQPAQQQQQQQAQQQPAQQQQQQQQQPAQQQPAQQQPAQQQQPGDSKLEAMLAQLIAQSQQQQAAIGSLASEQAAQQRRQEESKTYLEGVVTRSIDHAQSLQSHMEAFQARHLPHMEAFEVFQAQAPQVQAQASTPQRGQGRKKTKTSTECIDVDADSPEAAEQLNNLAREDF